MAEQSAEANSTAFMELRVGGCHLAIQKVPYRFLTFVVTVGTAVGTWFLAR